MKATMARRMSVESPAIVQGYLPLKPQDPDDAIWSVIRKLTGKIGESLTGSRYESCGRRRLRRRVLLTIPARRRSDGARWERASAVAVSHLSLFGSLESLS
jgi:hypothetical protein